MYERSLKVYSNIGYMKESVDGKDKIEVEQYIDTSSLFITNSKGEIVTNYHLETRFPVKVIKDKVVIEGMLEKIYDSDGYNNVALVVNGFNTIIYNPDEIIIKKGVKPTLTFKNKGKYTVSYLFNMIDWKCISTAMIEDDTLKMVLIADVNRSKLPKIEADVTLISEAYNTKNMVQPVMTKALMSAPVQNDNIGSIEDYVSYHLGNRIIDENVKFVLGNFETPHSRFYLCKTYKRNNVEFGYRFITPEYIPNTVVKIYSKRLNEYLGDIDIKEKQIGEEVELIVGNSSKLQCISEINPISEEVIGKDLKKITTNLTVRIKSFNDKESNLIIRHIANGKVESVSEEDYYKIEDGQISWHLKIEPRMETVFERTIVTIAYY